MDKANLHVHTKYSDGIKPVNIMLRDMLGAGINILCKTDQDSVEGNYETASLCRQHGIRFFHGIELTTYPVEGLIERFDSTFSLHILGYGIDTMKMHSHLVNYQVRKQRMLGELVNLLIADGYNLRTHILYGFDSMLKGRGAIARELVTIGRAKDVSDAFDNILNTESYIPFTLFPLSPKEIIEAIHSTGGLAVWSHPFHLKRGGEVRLKKEEVILYLDKLIEFGLDGIEAFYLPYDEESVEYLENLADSRGILKSVGTDYRGKSGEETLLTDPRLTEYTQKSLPLIDRLGNKGKKI
ncbi:MAG: PHP domain-containing protein [Christensenellales bacterium]|jgi:predicted metal-dependent phosphoesterase TrpH